MGLPSTVFGRLRKLLHVQFGIDTTGVSGASDLGQPPIGFNEDTIKSEFRLGLNLWFRDLIPPFGPVPWDQHTTVGRLVDDVLVRARVTNIKAYRMHAMTLADQSFSRAAGAGAQTVPLAVRQQVRDRMNADLEPLLIGRISLDDLAGDMPVILGNVLDRMVI